jgi:hypothetical protein
MPRTTTTHSSQVRGTPKGAPPSMPLEEQCPSTLLMNLVLEALRVRDERLN